jgi:alpha-L-fucosidase
MRSKWVTAAVAAAMMGGTVNVQAAEPAAGSFEPTWESLANIEAPEWFQDAKFGIMIHWGVYSVPAWVHRGYAEWYPFWLYRWNANDAVRRFHEEKFGPLPEFGYKDIVDLFKAEQFDANEWAELFEQAGARYVIPVGEHHDGFAMWASELTPWNAKDRGPKRDVIGELAEAVRARGMKYGVSYHRERHFAYYRQEAVQPEIDLVPEAALLYGPWFDLTEEFIEDYVARWKEIERKYEPDFMWIDDIPAFRTNRPLRDRYEQAFRQMIADYFNTAANEWGKEVYLNNKGKASLNWPEGIGAHSADNLRLNDIPSFHWENIGTISHSYGFHIDDEKHDRYRPSDRLIQILVDVVSKNGTYLLNVGPRGDGTIPESQASRLRDIGAWLNANGEAIYATRPWTVFGERGVRYTTHGNNLYAIFIQAVDRPFVLRATRGWSEGDVTGVTLVRTGESIPFTVTAAGLRLDLTQQPEGEHAWAFRIECTRPPAELPAINVFATEEE